MTSESGGAGATPQSANPLDGALGRRTFLRRAAVGVGAVAAAALVPAASHLATSDDSTTAAAQVAPNSTDPMVVYVRNAAMNEAVIMAGTTESVVVDAALVSTLMRAQDRHLA